MVYQRFTLQPITDSWRGQFCSRPALESLNTLCYLVYESFWTLRWVLVIWCWQWNVSPSLRYRYEAIFMYRAFPSKYLNMRQRCNFADPANFLCDVKSGAFGSTTIKLVLIDGSVGIFTFALWHRSYVWNWINLSPESFPMGICPASLSFWCCLAQTRHQRGISARGDVARAFPLKTPEWNERNPKAVGY